VTEGNLGVKLVRFLTGGICRWLTELYFLENLVILAQHDRSNLWM
jgi:hypothetical protein